MICQHSWQAWCLLIHLSLSSSKFPVGHLRHNLQHTPVAFAASTARTGWGPSSSSSARVTNLQTSIHAFDLQVVPWLCRHAFKEFLNIWPWVCNHFVVGDQERSSFCDMKWLHSTILCAGRDGTDPKKWTHSVAFCKLTNMTCSVTSSFTYSLWNAISKPSVSILKPL